MTHHFDRSPHRRSLLIALALVGALVLSSCRYVEVDGVGTRTADEDHPPQSDVTLVGCAPGELGTWQADLVIVNNSPAVATYEVMVGFYADDVRLSQRTHWVRALTPGETAEIERAWWIERPDDANSCRLLTVNRWS